MSSSSLPAALCPSCGGSNIYLSDDVSAGGGYAPNYLPGLSTFWGSAKFQLALCGDCGLVRFFARPEALAKLPKSKKWRRLE